MYERPAPKVLTVRMPRAMYDAAAGIAKKREISLNALVQDSLAAAIEADDYQTRYDAYTLLGQDLEECNVEYAIHAQAEVMLSDEY